MKPNISVVMAAHNDWPHVKTAVESIVNQDYGYFDFIIVDDYSTDKSARFLKTFKDSRIKLYRNNANVGLTRSLSRAMEYVTTPFVARMDADDYSEPFRLQHQLEYMRGHDLTLCGSDAWIIDDNSKVIKQKQRLSKHEDILFYTMLNNPFMHSSVMFKKDCYDEVGGYNNRVKYAQDYHLWARWVQKFKVGNINNPMVKWRQSSRGISTTRTASQKIFADKICLSYIRNAYPQLNSIPDRDVVAMRNGQYHAGNIINIDKLFDTVVEVSGSVYGKNWVECFRTRTRNLRG